MSRPEDLIVIAAARRTPMGAFQGVLSPLTAAELGAAAIEATLKSGGFSGDALSEVLMGCVLPAGQGQAPARQASLGAGIPNSVGCTTINKMCGSGMKAVMLAHDLIAAAGSDREVSIVSGGMESMSNAPYLLPKARGGYRMGHGKLLDHLFVDGLENPADGKLMGWFAEQTAKKYGYTREAQDEFAARSVRRALDAVASGRFAEEIAPVTVKTRRNERVVEQDEEPFRCDLEKLPTLRPAFAPDGTVTAASSSGIADGAAALLLMRRRDAEQHGREPLALIAGHSAHAQEPEWFTTANIGSIRNLHEKLGWSVGDVDLYEVNEAFAVVTMVAMDELEIPLEKMNVNGGACALGHPIGASGARILVTLIHALRQRGLKRGVAALCIGGGESTAVAVEIP